VFIFKELASEVNFLQCKTLANNSLEIHNFLIFLSLFVHRESLKNGIYFSFWSQRAIYLIDDPTLLFIFYLENFFHLNIIANVILSNSVVSCVLYVSFELGITLRLFSLSLLILSLIWYCWFIGLREIP